MNQKYRLKFHLMPPKGWMNDPNGLCFYKGLYHVFFQYAPSGPCAYERYWGHYTSPDFLHWKYEGIAIQSDCEWDRNGAFSGCAFTDDGLLELFYTGNVEEEGDYDYINAGRGANVIYVQSEDGVHFSEKKLLLSNKDYPADYTCHVRDPKVWKEGDTYHMVLGGRKKNDKGAILHYVSGDKMQWEFQEEISSEEDFGFMWECPDFFVLDGQQVLMCCPQGVTREEYRYQNPHQAGYWLNNTFYELDKGFDFYAPQTFFAPDGRRILYGWGGVSEMDKEYRNTPIIEEGWQHSLTVPRELKIVNGMIRQWPVKELEALRYNTLELNNGVTVVDADAFDLELICGSSQRIEIQLSEDILFSWQAGVFILQFLNDSGCGRQVHKAKISELRNIRILKDVSMHEIYINDGEYVFTTRYFPKDTLRTMLKLKGCDGAKLWKMKAMEVDLTNGEFDSE
ncbi:MAG: glycoside hydrolase family 32 protein [Lachnospiraceae bacterium]|nr:glycoside hydrolase family 32 protein [Lachnospiraceae bacterium]